ncbi:unnamed protein product, partial [Allacma fusca]
MRAREESRLPMNTDDINGYVNGVFGSFNVKISSEHGSLIAGMLNKFKTKTESPVRLQTAIQTFIDVGHTCGILTTAGYSMALVIKDDYLYFFDSHSRGPKGGVCVNGSSCVIKYEITTSARSLSALIHKNVQPRSIPNLDNTRYIQQFAFCIAPIAVTVCGGVNVTNSLSVESATTNVDTRREQIVEKIVQSQLPISTELGNCLMHTIEIREPEHSDVIDSHPKNFMLQRKTSRPVSSQVEEKLEELSFVKYFPRGRF